MSVLRWQRKQQSYSGPKQTVPRSITSSCSMFCLQSIVQSVVAAQRTAVQLHGWVNAQITPPAILIAREVRRYFLRLEVLFKIGLSRLGGLRCAKFAHLDGHMESDLRPPLDQFEWSI